MQNWQDELNPQSARECSLVQSIADAYWRTERIVRLEFALYAQGCIETTDTDGKGSSPTHKKAELATFLKYEKQMRNLSIQESRIRRQREKDMKELQNLQKQRSETVKVSERTHDKTTKTQSDTAAAATPPAERQRSAASGSAYAAASAQNQPNFSTKSGFEFSTAHLRSGLDAKLNLALPKLTKESR
ncbi:MAG: hypothetical protein INR62_03280 [Rhodospirillales bacterium]|nr:hypothetical protein [Acetobacter sp.]